MNAAILTLLITSSILGAVYSQETDRPRLAGTWSGGEDSSEFIYHKVEEFAFSFLKDNPDAKFVARICSSRRMVAALARASAVVNRLPYQASYFRVPAERVFFARSSKCTNGHEQYWYVPGAVSIEYDELISTQKVRIKGWTVDRKNVSAAAKNEFMENVRDFVREMKDDPKSEGFVFRNSKTGRYQMRAVEKLLEAEGVDRRRIQILKQARWSSHYPALKTIAVN